MQGADHSEGERLVEAERIADRESKLADFEVGGAANRDRLWNRLRITQTNNSEIIIWCRADDIRRDGLPAGKPDHHIRRAVDHMVVGDDIAGAVPDKSGSGLHARTVLIKDISAALPPYDLHDRRRDSLEQCGDGLLGIGEVTARRDSAWRGLGQ